jgi:hypothetical protein
MALKFRITGRRPLGGTREAVDAEWYDDGGADLRPDLIAEAARLEARAAQLRADAKVVPDQFVSDADRNPGGKHATDKDVADDAAKNKRDLLVQQLGIKNP